MSSTKGRPRSTGRGEVYPVGNRSSGSDVGSAACRKAADVGREMRGEEVDRQRLSELQYGPGIVDRLKSRFIELTSSDERQPELSRSRSLENLLEDGAASRAIDRRRPDRSIVRRNRAKYDLSWRVTNNFKKAQSMETLVNDSPADTPHEYPRRDTVKTYKRMFEPAESKQVNRRKQPPVLRASAKSCNRNGAINATQPAKDKLDATQKRAQPQPSLVFDFRGKSNKTHLTVQPAPFGCQPVQKSVRKFYRLFEGLPDGAEIWDDDDETDGGGERLPHPSGISFLGENVRVGRGSLLVDRNKNLRIQFNDKVTTIHEYPSELSLMEENDRIDSTNDTSHLELSGLASYTPSVLKSGQAYHLGHPRTTQTQVPENKEDSEEKEQSEELKPADPESTPSWSSSAATTDLLF